MNCNVMSEYHQEPGAAVAKVVQTPEPTLENPAPEEKKKVNKVAYSEHPSIPDQFEKIPESVISDGTVTKTLNLSIPAQEEAYNNIISETYPLAAPKVRVTRDSVEFFEGKFYVLITYQKLLYQKL